MPLRTRPAAISVGLAAGLSACLSFDPFACTENDQCVLGESMGVCAQGWCAYDDPECAPTNLRFDDNAGGGLAGQCLSMDAATDSDPTVASTTTESTSGDPSGPTTDDPSTTVDPSDTTTTDSTETGTGECGNAGANCCPDESCNEGLACMAGRCGCVTEIAAGPRHNCLIKVDGSVWCWGDNVLGQLGGSAEAFETTPVPVGGDVSPAVELSAWTTTCAVRDDASARCWGDNASGQVNPGDLVSTVLGPTQNSSGVAVVHVATGRNHTCFGRSGENAATCFGANTLGQLTGAQPGPGPIDVPAAFNFAEMQAGLNHTCGRVPSGDVYCWGSNANGQLGADPGTVPISDVLRQVTLPPAGELAVGRNHTCARLGNEIRCWGENSSGELGDGTGLDNPSPDTTALVPTNVTVVDLVAAPDHTCVISGSGQLYCWGSNANGQLRLPPDDMGADQLLTLTPVEIDVGGVVVEQVAGGATHTCILTNRGEVLCWGTNDVGQIGDGSTAFAFDPTPVQVSCP